MKYSLKSTSIECKNILKTYPIISKYNPTVDYPYHNKNRMRMIIEVDNLIKFYDDIGVEEIIIRTDDMADEDMYCIEIYDGYRE